MIKAVNISAEKQLIMCPMSVKKTVKTKATICFGNTATGYLMKAYTVFTVIHFYGNSMLAHLRTKGTKRKSYSVLRQ